MNRKSKILLLIASMVFISFNINDESPDKKKQNSNLDNTMAVIDSKQMNANAIRTFYRTNGSFNRDPSTGNAGFEWPKGSDKYARYASGIWLGCVSGNDTLTAVSEYSYDYAPGYVDNFGNPQTDSTYRIYVINKNVVNSYDYLHWPGNQGAYKTSEGKPYMMGDQTMFFVYTEAFPHASGSTSLRSLKAQILQTNWTYKPSEFYIDYPSDPFNNTIFMEYRIINRSNKIWNNMWVGLWTDDDLGSATDDKVGCDTNFNIGYTYNSNNNDGIYGTAPPAVGLKFIRGSYKYTGNPYDVIEYYRPFGSKNIIVKRGFKDEGLTAFVYYNSGSPQPSDPISNIETYRVLKGWWRLGGRWVNPVTQDTTNKPFSGDPVNGTGWLMSGENDRRSITSTGPFNKIFPGDTITIVAAQIIAKGNSNLNSITQLRNTAKIIQNFYDNNLTPQTISPSPNISSYAPGDGKIYLTWTDTNQTGSFNNILSGGTYKFQGYNIYQIRTYTNQPVASDTVLLKTFDIKDGITNITDSIYIPPNQGIFYGIVQTGSDNGISRYFEVVKDTLTNGSFINGTEYKFAVTSYYYDPSGGLYTYPKVNESPKANIIKVVPQSISPGTQVSYQLGDTLNTDQKDLAVMPIVYDPLQLVTATYSSTFGASITGRLNAQPCWTVTKSFNGVTAILFENIYNFTGTQDSVRKADGLLFNHQLIKDSGLVIDPNDQLYLSNGINIKANQKCWTYEPNGEEWFTAPDTTAIKTAKLITGRQFQSKSLGMSFPTSNTFRGAGTRVKANSKYFSPVSNISPILNGGPLRKIKIVFGQSQNAYRFKPAAGNVLLTDTNLSQPTLFADMVTIPFSVFAAEELDSTHGTSRQLNVAFVDSDADGTWNPDTTKLGRYQFTYIFASNYFPKALPDYTSKNLGINGTITGFATTDAMYAWLPRIKNVNGVPAQWSNGDVLTVTPYRITRPEFVPGYPVKYNWSVTGASYNKQLATSEINNIKVFPNPYYGFSTLDLNDAGEKFIYLSHLPQSCTIYFYTLNGTLVNKINRNESNPNNSLEKWDLKNEGGSYVASGMYIVYVDCKELGAKTLKIAVFTQ